MIFPALYNKMEEFSEQKIFILVSTVMTWACSKAVDPVGGASLKHVCSTHVITVLLGMMLSRSSSGLSV